MPLKLQPQAQPQTLTWRSWTAQESTDKPLLNTLPVMPKRNQRLLELQLLDLHPCSQISPFCITASAR